MDTRSPAHAAGKGMDGAEHSELMPVCGFLRYLWSDGYPRRDVESAPIAPGVQRGGPGQQRGRNGTLRCCGSVAQSEEPPALAAWPREARRGARRTDAGRIRRPSSKGLQTDEETRLGLALPGSAPLLLLLLLLLCLLLFLPPAALWGL